ncbi:MAG TPA: hypothetical protein VHE54_16360 [Puia sp.]|nr:hypothetical protein [Puia sp.]
MKPKLTALLCPARAPGAPPAGYPGFVQLQNAGQHTHGSADAMAGAGEGHS